jgi:hypothetical protein
MSHQSASRKSLLVLSLLGLAAISFPGWSFADLHLRVPQDIQPPVYTSAGGPFTLPDGTVFALHDDEWAAIPFWRPAECIRPDFNLLESFDLAALDCPLLVDGFVRWRNGPVSWEARGVGTVPIWFVLRTELEQATADDELTIVELAALGSLLVGTADFYHEQNHGFAIHPVSHLALVAWGTLEDGRRFSLRVVEVKLGLVQVHIVFR